MAPLPRNNGGGGGSNRLRLTSSTFWGVLKCTTAILPMPTPLPLGDWKREREGERVKGGWRLSNLTACCVRVGVCET